MSRPPRPPHAARTLAALALVLAAAWGCGGGGGRAVRVDWWLGRTEPAFDPDGPYDPARVALERLMTRSLVALDSSGSAVPQAAERWTWSSDSLRLEFTLRAGLRFTDGTPCSSAHFARALAAGLGRPDHATRAWALGAVRGVSLVRAGRPLPSVGIETPDPRTLRLDLARRDRRLPEKIAATHASEAWRDRGAAGWSEAVGLGPMRAGPGGTSARLPLVRAAGARGVPDTIVARFAIGDGRARVALRAGTPDLIWPLPPGLRSELLPRGYRLASDSTGPTRTLALVLRADLPPTTKLAARRALAHAFNRNEIARALEPPASPPGALVPGAPRFESPGFDLREMHAWMDQGRLGLSFHATLAFDADGPGATIARAMQGEWSRAGLYVDLLPLRGEKWFDECLRGSKAHLLLVEWEPPGAGVGPALSSLLMPVRGPAVGTFRTGWRTRELDGWLDAGSVPAAGAAAIQHRIEQDVILLPIARSGATWVTRADRNVAAFGRDGLPEFDGTGGRADARSAVRR